MDTTRRGNYDSGQDFVLEYGELRFNFNERDFGERCEQAALKVGFVDGRLNEPELEDLVNLVVNGEVHDPASALGEHVTDCWPDLVGPPHRSLVHWLARPVFPRPPGRRGRADRAGSRAVLGPRGLRAALSVRAVDVGPGPDGRMRCWWC